MLNLVIFQNESVRFQVKLYVTKLFLRNEFQKGLLLSCNIACWLKSFLNVNLSINIFEAFDLGDQSIVLNSPAHKIHIAVLNKFILMQLKNSIDSVAINICVGVIYGITGVSSHHVNLLRILIFLSVGIFATQFPLRIFINRRNEHAVGLTILSPSLLSSLVLIIIVAREYEWVLYQTPWILIVLQIRIPVLLVHYQL